jgi:hypothetical protein
MIFFSDLFNASFSVGGGTEKIGQIDSFFLGSFSVV